MVLDSRLYTGVDLEESELHHLGSGLAAIYTHRSPFKDTTNEDSAAIIPFDNDSGVLVVADGAGGRPSGAKASQIAIHSLHKHIHGAAKRGVELRSAILDAIEEANGAVIKLGVGAATTLAVVEIRGDQVRPYHIGDSQILLFGQRGRLKLQTMSHSPVGYAVEAGMLDEKEAMFHDERHLISNMLGEDRMHVEIGSTVTLNSKDTLVVASDGLFDNLTYEEIIDAARKGPLLATSRQMVESCQARMKDESSSHPCKPDDLTIITFRLRVSE